MSRKSTAVRNMIIFGFILTLLTTVNIYSMRIKTNDEQKAAIESKAGELATELQSKVGLSGSQFTGVKEVLVNYLTNVSIIQFTQRAGAREKTYDVKSDPPSDLQDLNLNYEDNTLDDLRNADKEANSKLDNILSNKDKWKDIKDLWWSKVIEAQYEEK
jgi:hypothetical protein